jgi:hypothetical protein
MRWLTKSDSYLMVWPEACWNFWRGERGEVYDV